MGQGGVNNAGLHSLWHNRCEKRRPNKAGKFQVGSRGFRAQGWEQLEARALLTAAATITWTGGSSSSSNWSDPANWDLDRAPISGDNIVFPASTGRLANNDDIPGLSITSITFQGTFSASGGYTSAATI